MAAEWMSYWVDVRVLGVPYKKRYYHYFKPCKCCGWAHFNCSNYMDKEEKLKLKEMHREK
jgi:hypothetical protein